MAHVTSVTAPARGPGGKIDTYPVSPETGRCAPSVTPVTDPHAKSTRPQPGSREQNSQVFSEFGLQRGATPARWGGGRGPVALGPISR